MSDDFKAPDDTKYWKEHFKGREKNVFDEHENKAIMRGVEIGLSPLMAASLGLSSLAITDHKQYNEIIETAAIAVLDGIDNLSEQQKGFERSINKFLENQVSPDVDSSQLKAPATPKRAAQPRQI